MRISFFPFGPISQASARLRAHYIADALRARGHDVEIDARPDAELVVFQKKRNFAALFEAKRRGARVVYDFDDHYLLDDSGARDEILKIVNLADVVTVGSHELLQAASAYHPNVRLFENPIDVLPGAARKSDYDWRSRLAWFGNRTNLVALDALDLALPVTTITAHGDIEWALETVDAHIAAADLVLLPVEQSAWTLAKNANRLFKCAALAVPFLAADTPEHRRAVEELGLPEWFLVGDRSAWRDAIRSIEARYDELPELMRAASVRAHDAFGIERQAERWLDAVLDPIEPGVRASEVTRRFARGVDVVVLAERTPDRTQATLASARAVGCELSSVSTISALPAPGSTAPAAADFFDIYPALATRIGGSAAEHTLIVQAGVELRPSVMAELARTAHPDRVVILRPQIGPSQDPTVPVKPGTLVDEPPQTVPELVSEPFLPLALLVPAQVWHEHSIDVASGALWAWDLLLDLAAKEREPIVLSAPVSLVAPETYRATPIHGHAAHLQLTAPEVAAELPNMTTEWQRLRSTLASHVVERHRALFERWIALVATRPYSHAATPSSENAQNQIARLSAKLAESSANTKRALKAQAKQQRKIDELEAELKRYVKKRAKTRRLPTDSSSPGEWRQLARELSHLSGTLTRAAAARIFSLARRGSSRTSGD